MLFLLSSLLFVYIRTTISSCPLYQCTACTVTPLSTVCTACPANSNRTVPVPNCPCDAGYFDVGAPACVACSYTCANCTNGTACSACSSTNNRTMNSSSQCQCNSGYYDDGTHSNCTKCSYTCVTCYNGISCASCQSSYNRTLNTTNYQCQCNTGYYDDGTNKQCAVCNHTCTTCTNGTSCASCSTLLFRNLNSSQCPCNQGYYDDLVNLTCQSCSYTCLTCTNSSVCATCQATSNRTMNSSSQCQCNAGSYDDGTNKQCAVCNYTCATCNDGLSCATCASPSMRQVSSSQCPCTSGYYDDGSNSTCALCSYSCLTCNDGVSCASCLTTSQRNLNQSQCLCNQGYYNLGINQTCVQCSYTCLTCNTGTTCQTCLKIAHRSINSSQCPCDTGYYNDYANTTCQSCQYPCFTCTNATSCATCSLLNFRTTNSTSCSCISGYFDDGIQTSCQLCAYPCSTCNDGLSCVSCLATNNRYLNSTQCLCNAGFYDDGINQLCAVCNYTCGSCSTQQACSTCSISSHRSINSTSQSCTCNSGYYDNKNTTCSSCDYSCGTCNQLTTCLSCAIQSHRQFVMNQCQCNSGYFDDGKNNNCNSCPYACVTCSNALICNSCPAQSNRQLLSSQCACKQGYYDNGSDVICHQCHYSCDTCQDGNSCTTCSMQYYRTLGNSQCVCTLGFFDNGASATCELVPIFYLFSSLSLVALFLGIWGYRMDKLDSVLVHPVKDDESQEIKDSQKSPSQDHYLLKMSRIRQGKTEGVLEDESSDLKERSEAPTKPGSITPKQNLRKNGVWGFRKKVENLQVHPIFQDDHSQETKDQVKSITPDITPLKTMTSPLKSKRPVRRGVWGFRKDLTESNPVFSEGNQQGQSEKQHYRFPIQLGLASSELSITSRLPKEIPTFAPYLMKNHPMMSIFYKYDKLISRPTRVFLIYNGMFLQLGVSIYFADSMSIIKMMSIMAASSFGVFMMTQIYYKLFGNEKTIIKFIGVILCASVNCFFAYMSQKVTADTLWVWQANIWVIQYSICIFWDVFFFQIFTQILKHKLQFMADQSGIILYCLQKICLIERGITIFIYLRVRNQQMKRSIQQIWLIFFLIKLNQTYNDSQFFSYNLMIKDSNEPGTFKQLCGINQDKTVDLTKIIFYGFYIFFTTLGFSFLVIKLCNSLQMFPIKEKSGKLILLFVLINYLFLISYPLLMMINFDFENDPYSITSWISGVLRFLYNFYVLTYFMRALRIHYAYDIRQKLSGVNYSIVKNENILCFLTIVIGLIIFLAPQDFLPYEENIFNSPEIKNESHFENYKIQKLVVVLINQLILLFSLFLIRKAKTTFKIQTELAYAILLEFSFSLIKKSFSFFMSQTDHDPLCYNKFPSYYAMDCCKIFALIWLTVLAPLMQVEKISQHFPYPIVADNFELFLSETICIDTFHKYLLYNDNKTQRSQQQMSNNKYSL